MYENENTKCETLGLAVKTFFWAIGEARIASPERVASQSEATVLALPLKASLALLRGFLPVSEAEIVSLLSLSGASFLTSRLSSLALSGLVLSLAASLGLPNSADDVSGAAVASLLAQRSLALASRDRRGLAL